MQFKSTAMNQLNKPHMFQIRNQNPNNPRNHEITNIVTTQNWRAKGQGYAT